MAKPPSSSGFSKKILLGISAASLPLAGCVVAPEPRPSENETVVFATTEEATLYRRAKETQTKDAAESFLNAFPESNLVRSLLTSLPQATLRRIERQTVDGLDRNVVRTLPLNIRLALGVATQSDEERTSGSSDGYSG